MSTPTHRLRRCLRTVVILPLGLLLATACAGDDQNDAGDSGTSAGGTSAADSGDDPGTDGELGSSSNRPGSGTETFPDFNADCDLLDETICSFPWPSGLYLVPDSSRQTGYTLTFGETSLPANGQGRHIQPDRFTDLDGYGLGVPIMTVFPNLDVTGLATEYDVGPSMDPDAPVLLLRVDGDALVQTPYWTELDRVERTASRRTFIVRPAVILEENTRYVVAFRELVDTEGNLLPRSDGFTRLLEGRTQGHPQLEARQPVFDDLLERLDAHGVSSESLTLAWDFVTGSSDGLHGTMLAIRDDAFAVVGDAGPELTITEIIDYLPAPDPENPELRHHPDIALQVSGTMRVPHYLEGTDVSGTTLWGIHLGSDGKPAQNGWRDADFLVRVPHGAMDGTPHGIITYGHGLLGNRNEIRAGHIGHLANSYGWIVVGADLVGMSAGDVDAIQTALNDMTRITTMTDRLHQGMLEYLLLTRATREQLEGLLRDRDYDIRVDRDAIAYFGGSQGGIFGQTYMALTTDVRHGFLAVPGTNYSALLQRSTGFRPFAQLLGVFYSGSSNLLTVIAATQLLWDRTDPVSYARRIPNPFDGQEERRALSVVAKADWQVAVSTMENVVRSQFGTPALENWDRERTDPPGFEWASYPHQGSGVINYDFNNPWPHGENRPPEDNFGDPHSLHSAVPAVGDQLDRFLRFGEIIDACEGTYCYFPREPRD